MSTSFEARTRSIGVTRAQWSLAVPLVLWVRTGGIQDGTLREVAT